MTENSYPLAIDPLTIQVTGTVTIPASSGGSNDAPTQRGYDAVRDLGMDASGKQDCAASLQMWMNGLQGQRTELHFPPGRYYFASTVETNAKGIKIIGDGVVSRIANGAVTFCTDKALDALLWFNCDQSASNLEGPWIKNIQFQDTSASHNQLGCAIRITNTANSELKVGFLNMVPKRYTAGIVTVSTNSRTVIGQGTNWTPDMCPGWMVIDGYPYEIVDVMNATMLSIAIAYQGASADKSYAINYRGIGVWCDPGLGFTQYGTNWHLNGRIACALFCSAGTATGMYTGTSRIKIQAGYLNGMSLPDSMAAYLGPFSDTVEWHVAMNSFAFGVVVANGHQHQLLDADYENAGGAPPVTGKPSEYSSCHGVLVMSDNSSDTWGNRIGGYYRQVGTAIELYGQAGKAPTQTVIGVCTFRSNKANFVNGHATNTQGFIPASTYSRDRSLWHRLWRWLCRLLSIHM